MTQRREARAYAALEPVRKAYPIAVSKDDVYAHLVATFGIRKATAVEDVDSVVDLGWLRWDGLRPGHLVFGPRAPVEIRRREGSA